MKQNHTHFLLAFFVLLFFSSVAFAETDVTDSVDLIQGRLLFDRTNNTNYVDVSVKNSSQDVLLSPIKVVIDSISVQNISVANADGLTDSGKPYFEYSVEPSTLSPDQITATKKWIFNNPLRKRFNYTYSVIQIDFEGNLGSVQPVLSEDTSIDPDTGLEHANGQVLIAPR